MQLLWITVFGAAGVALRYAGDRLLGGHSNFPISTFAINIAGSFGAGLLYQLGGRALSADLQQALMVGFLGGFTTFSAFSLQCLRMIETGNAGLAAAYLTLGPVLGVGAAYLGVMLAR